MSISRRGILKASLGLGGVALFEFSLPGFARAAGAAPVDVSAWLRVAVVDHVLREVVKVDGTCRPVVRARVLEENRPELSRTCLEIRDDRRTLRHAHAGFDHSVWAVTDPAVAPAMRP